MPQANTYSTPSTQGGNREDLRNVLTILEPEETPFTSLCEKADAPKSTYPEVLADTLRKPRTTGTREGQDAGKGNNKAKDRQRFGSYLHRVMDEFGVTDVQQLISKSGGVAAVSDEYAEAKAKTIREMKRDIEAINCGDQEMQGGSDDEMRTRGANKWIQAAAQAVQPVPANFRPTGGDPDSTQSVIKTGVTGVDVLTESTLVNILKNLSKVHGGKREYQCIAGDNICQTVDNFTRIVGESLAATNAPGRHAVTRQYTQSVDSHKITLNVTLYDSTFGRLHLIPTQFNKIDANGDGDANVAYILHMNLWQMMFLEHLHAVDQEENAGGMSGYAKAIFNLICKNPKGNGKIINS